ncbi:hypothetical protein FSP39_008711 [Pinctada imbricata]|uniref:Uncharacterized protein n=1 Tax=Pinctada imbricata TaxID=66713 RepID=A0AA88XYR1_PINIB|nr:hypothetical protein FSP39_008711 [Pinctada imbricata]
MDWYASALCVMLGAFLECIVVAWVYGAERFSRDVELMTGARVGRIVRFAWCILTPLIMIVGFLCFVIQVMILLTLFGLSPPSTDDYTYPGFAHVVGVIIALTPCLPVPMGMMYGLLKEKGSFYKRLRMLLSPSHTWGPNDPELRKSYKMYQYEGTWIENMRTNLLGSRKRNPELTPMNAQDSDLLQFNE